MNIEVGTVLLLINVVLLIVNWWMNKRSAEAYVRFNTVIEMNKIHKLERILQTKNRKMRNMHRVLKQHGISTRPPVKE